MSWQTYIDTLEAGDGSCKYAAVASTAAPASIWAESQKRDDFFLTQEELTKLAYILKGGATDITTMGITFHGIKFAFVRLEDESLVLQGKGDYKEYSFVAAASGTAMVIGMNPDPNVKTPKVRGAVENVRDYLKSVGY